MKHQSLSGDGPSPAGAMSLVSLLQYLRAEHGEHPALLRPGAESEEVLSYEQLALEAERVARGLWALGVRRGDRIVAFLPTSPEWVVLIFAAAGLGATIVGANTRYRSGELAALIVQAEACVVVVPERFLSIDVATTVCSAVSAAREAPAVVVVPNARPGWASLTTSDWDALEGDPVPRGEWGGSACDGIVAFTTSGTTGHPKLALHDQDGVVRHALASAHAFCVDADSVGLVVLPMCGTFGFSTTMSLLAGGATCVLPPRFDPPLALALVDRYGVTHLNGSDDMLAAVFDAATGSELASWVVGGYADFANHGAEVARRAELAHGIRLSGLYGSSECFALLATWAHAAPLAERARNGGRLVSAEMEVRVADPEGGQVLSDGRSGELQFRGPSVTLGYLGDRQATRRSFSVDGWFRSGDLGRLVDDGSFEYLARMGDALRLRGFLVDPADIEAALTSHPSVASAQVVGALAPSGRVVAAAFVKLQAGALSEADLREHCRARLADFKVPELVVIVDGFPTVVGTNGIKIRKEELKRQAELILANQPCTGGAAGVSATDPSRPSQREER